MKAMIKKEEYPEKKDIVVLYPNRGKRLEEEDREYEEIYKSIITNEDIKGNEGKIIAIDIDRKIVIERDYDIQKVTNSVRDYAGLGRNILEE